MSSILTLISTFFFICILYHSKLINFSVSGWIKSVWTKDKQTTYKSKKKCINGEW